MPGVTTVTNEADRTFTVRLVLDGDRYGRRDVLTHHGEEVVEFYDATFADDPRFTDGMGRGQFVSSYYLSTLADEYQPRKGLTLHGGSPEWRLDAWALTQALVWALRTALALLRPKETT